jgi:hypothetical protein
MKIQRDRIVSEIIDVIVTLAGPRGEAKLVRKLQYDTSILTRASAAGAKKIEEERICATRVSKPWCSALAETAVQPIPSV